MLIDVIRKGFLTYVSPIDPDLIKKLLTRSGEIVQLYKVQRQKRKPPISTKGVKDRDTHAEFHMKTSTTPQAFYCEPRWPSGKAVRLISRKDLGSIPLRLSFLFKKVVVCGHCLVTLSLAVNETLKWLSSLPILMQESFWW